MVQTCGGLFHALAARTAKDSDLSRLPEQDEVVAELLPLARQLHLSFTQGAANPEELLNVLCQGREDVPGGMSRLAV